MPPIFPGNAPYLPLFSPEMPPILPSNLLEMPSIHLWPVCDRRQKSILHPRYLRKLDQELHKFQLELEADNRGITEVMRMILLMIINFEGAGKAFS